MITHTKNLQKEVLHIQVEDIPLAKEALSEQDFRTILDQFSTQIEYTSTIPSELVHLGSRAFLVGMYHAYADHRPFTISPEMLWLLIVQGMTQHFNYNTSAITQYFPELLERKDLVVRNDAILLGNPNSPWPEVIPEFLNQMKEYLGTDFIDHFRADFSSTSPVEQAVCDLTIMDAMSPFFEYHVAVCVCGIPSIHLEGTVADWDRILQKLNHLKQYDLEWWFKDLIPIIEQIKSSYLEGPNIDFWRSMFKVHTKEDYGRPRVADGWIIQFFPYTKKGVQLSRESLFLGYNELFPALPNQLRIIDFKYHICDGIGNILETIPMEFWAGFIGLSQNKKTLCLRPEMAWFVSHKTDRRPEVPYDNFESNSRKYHLIDTFPEVLLNGEYFEELFINFKDTINFPENIADINTGLLCLNGKINETILQDLRKKFKGNDTFVVVNEDWDGIFG